MFFDKIDGSKRDLASANWTFKIRFGPHLGESGATKSDNFSEKFQRAFDSPLIFRKIYCKSFIMDIVAYMQRYEGQIV